MKCLQKTIPLLAVLSAAPAASTARAEDGAALVKKMEAAYGGLKSYRQTMRATGQVDIEGSARSGVMTAELRYQAPNRILMILASPAVGTITITADSKQEVLYFSKRNAVLRRPAPGSMKDFVEGLKRYQIVSILDPLYFLAGERASTLATGFTSQGREAVSGFECDKVAGTLRRNMAQTAREGKVTFWIDRSNSLLRKVHIELRGVPVKTVSRSGPKSRPVTVISISNQAIVEIISRLQINPLLSDKDLTLAVPPTAKVIPTKPSP